MALSYLFVEPEIVTVAAAQVAEVGSAIGAASAAAAAPTSNLLAAAADEVSAAVANFFGAFGREYQDLLTQLTGYQNQFQRTITAAATAYSTTEVASAAALPWVPNDVSLFMSGTGVPIVTSQFIQKANDLYVGATGLLRGLNTPEELYPLTGVRSLYFNKSVDLGLTILDNAVFEQIQQGRTVTVFGVSQSAVISSLYMRNLAAGLTSFGANPPGAGELNFLLAGNEMNPNGGLLSRFPGLSMTSLGLDFYGSTPSDTIYPTKIYTLEYDGFADFPKYPLNIVADLNAIAGIIYVHPTYLSLTQAQVANAIQLTPSPGYTGNTEYYIIPTEHLPLLQPLRAIPGIGNPLANLLEPTTRAIVNLGYGDPAYGYSTSPPDVPTPFGLFPEVAPSTVFNALTAGVQQGVTNFSSDVQVLLSQPPVVPTLDLPIPTALPSPSTIANTVASIISTNYSVLLPTADIGLSMVTSLPAYNLQLFTEQLAQGNLINAIGYPIAADIGLATVAGGVEVLVIAEAAVNTIRDIQSLFA